WVDLAWLTWLVYDVAVSVVRAGLSACRAGMFIVRDARAMRSSANILSKMRSVVRTQRAGKYGVEGFWKLRGEKFVFNARKLKIKLTPSVGRSIAESEVLAQMRAGYAQYLRGAGAKAGRSLSQRVPMSAWDKARALTAMDVPHAFEVPQWLKSVGSSERGATRYALKYGYAVLGESGAVRSEAEQLLVSWARENGSLVERGGYLYLPADTKVPGYISAAMNGEITPQAAMRMKYAQQNKLYELGPKNGVRSEVQQKAYDWLAKNNRIREYDGYLYISQEGQYPTHVIEGVQGKLDLAGFERGQQQYERAVFAQQNGLREVGPRSGFSRQQIRRMKGSGAVEHEGYLYARPDAKVWQQRSYVVGLDGKPIRANQPVQVWTNVGRNESVVSDGAVRTAAVKPAAKPVVEAEPVAQENPYLAQAEKIHEEAAQRAAMRAQIKQARLAKIDKYTFGLGSKVKGWRIGRKIRQGITSVMTAGMLTAASPAMAVSEAAPVAIEQTAGAVARTSMLPAEGLLIDPKVVEKGLPGVMSLPMPSLSAETRLLTVGEISEKLAAQQKAFNSFIQMQQTMLLSKEGVRLAAVREGLSPAAISWRMGLYNVSHAFDHLRLGVQKFELRNNPYYKAYQQDLALRAQQAAQQAAAEAAVKEALTKYNIFDADGKINEQA
ncbi:MAG: hypothetical protein IKN49_06755, partial [Elusimicrobiaceae bacterium]|nr:hypothetical protein [Elusimicrobiaceae bacterium]